ncbi:hypothetical protein ACFQZW_12925 [Lutibacter aestuarii]|uniref:Uncharacterized protein n=1 Tax=Lutibacter aestuarii TaxID=861111 RepID=A0ABW2ZB64_9FLAO
MKNSERISGNKKDVKSKASSVGKTLKIKFLLSPTGKYNLAYNEGEVAELPELKAKELIDDEYAIKVK